MTDEGTRNSLIHKLKQSYRLIVLKDATFAEVASTKLSPLRAAIVALACILIILTLFSLFVIYTPVKRLIPGYGELQSNLPYVELKDRVVKLESQLDDYKIYTENFREMLVDSVQYAEDIEMAPSREETETVEINRIPEDDSLRAMVDINKDLLRIAEAKARRTDRTNAGLDELYLFTPLNGIKSKAFNIADNHYGIDIVAPEGSTVKSVAAGVVIIALNSVETGYTIGIQHDNDLVTYYKHNSVLLKKEGDRVDRGEAIAIIGNTGELTSGPHLHFEMWYKGKALNPERYIKQLE